MFLTTFFLSWMAPTELYIAKYPLEEIKYNLRLEHVTLENRTLYDKAIAEETEGFFGYFGASAKFRIYQDVIRMVFEEVLKIDVREDFHFLAVPLYPERTLQELEDVSHAFFEGTSKAYNLRNQLFPFNLSFYANHKTHGYSPIKSFVLNTQQKDFQDLLWLFDTLGLDKDLLEKAFLLGVDENPLLLQFFDTSKESYSFIDKNSYPAWPSGYPFKNSALSDDIQEDYPPQYFLLLNDHATLNPNSPFTIKRYSKVQSSKIKAYEQSLRELIKSASFDMERRDAYLNKLTQVYL